MFPGFSNKKRSTISRGDFDRDGVRNRKDCEPLNFKKQHNTKDIMIEKLEGDDYEVSWNEGYGPDKAATFKTEKEAKRALGEVKAKGYFTQNGRRWD